jgi:GT2 family glycosyltransferase
MPSFAVTDSLAIVVIGRNEGPRLVRALEAALKSEAACVVYVDSGSSDGSLERARSLGPKLSVQALEATLPFTAARGRNRGFELARARVPGLTHVQFVDGDCVLTDGYIESARAYFAAHPDAGIVAGVLREEQREKNVYHRLADMEWDGPLGDVASTGGIFMIRADVFQQAGGFDGTVAAGEELELAQRVRARGFRIVRIPQEMARHDIDMARFVEWWQRSVRTGQSYAEGLFIQVGRGDDVHLKPVASILAYGAVLPTLATLFALPTLGLSLSLLASHALLWRRIRKLRLKHGDRPDDAALYATAVVLTKFANVRGMARFAGRWARGELSHGTHMLDTTRRAPSQPA